MIRRGRLPLVLLAVLAVAGTSSCTDSPSAALQSMEDGEATICAPLDDQGRVVIGVSVFRNLASTSLSIESVDLVDAEGIEVIGAEFPTTDDANASVVGLPYDEYGPDPLAADVTIDPGAEVVLLIGLAGDPTMPGSAAAAEISYRVGDGSEEVTRTLIGMQVVPEGQVCG